MPRGILQEKRNCTAKGCNNILDPAEKSPRTGKPYNDNNYQCWDCWYEFTDSNKTVTQGGPTLYIMEYYNFLTKRNILEGVYKIGYTANPLKRMSDLSGEAGRGGTLGPIKVRIVEAYQCEDAKLIEDIIHKELEDVREHGEWFRISKTKAKEICQKHTKSLSSVSNTPLIILTNFAKNLKRIVIGE